MRRYVIVFVLFTLCTMMIHAESRGQFTFNIDFAGTHKISGSEFEGDAESELGLSPGLEFLFPLSDFFMLGFAGEYQFERGIDADWASSSAKFGFMPVYITSKIGFLPDEALNPEINLNIGYAFMYANDQYEGLGDVNGGLFYAIGGGLVLGDKLVANLLYRYQTGTLETAFTKKKYDITQTQMSLMLAWRM